MIKECNNHFVVYFLDLDSILFHVFHCWLRNYPPDFGKKLVKIFSELITNKTGMPTLPNPVPDAKDTFESATYDDCWPDADVTGVVHWLRGGKDLRIPCDWRPLLPCKL